MANLVEDRNKQFLAISKDLFANLTRTHLPSAVEAEVTRRDAAQDKPSVEDAVRTYVRHQADRDLVKDVGQEVSREVSRDYFGSDYFRSLLKEEAAAGMHELMSGYAGRKVFLDKLLKNARMQWTIGNFAIKAVKIAVENSPHLLKNGGETNVRDTAESDDERLSGKGSARNLSAEEITCQSLAKLRAQAERRKKAQERCDERNVRIKEERKRISKAAKPGLKLGDVMKIGKKPLPIRGGSPSLHTERLSNNYLQRCRGLVDSLQGQMCREFAVNFRWRLRAILAWH